MGTDLTPFTRITVCCEVRLTQVHLVMYPNIFLTSCPCACLDATTPQYNSATSTTIEACSSSQILRSPLPTLDCHIHKQCQPLQPIDDDIFESLPRLIVVSRSAYCAGAQTISKASTSSETLRSLPRELDEVLENQRRWNANDHRCLREPFSSEGDWLCEDGMLLTLVSTVVWCGDEKATFDESLRIGRSTPPAPHTALRLRVQSAQLTAADLKPKPKLKGGAPRRTEPERRRHEQIKACLCPARTTSHQKLQRTLRSVHLAHQSQVRTKRPDPELSMLARNCVSTADVTANPNRRSYFQLTMSGFNVIPKKRR
ncbi:unnamed protein product [Toxocara canis]|uniref:Uncharacterized protein n=1 Tax=Toxocara canis TaxID=6265 RepID=A0A183UBJ3_TOXCA|nr:unnamed protein product [Toxocara canis]